MSSSVGDPGSIAAYDSFDSHDSRSCRRSVRKGLSIPDALVVSICDVLSGSVRNFPVTSICTLVLNTSGEGSEVEI